MTHLSFNSHLREDRMGYGTIQALDRLGVGEAWLEDTLSLSA
jgi:hypothetical protein